MGEILNIRRGMAFLGVPSPLAARASSSATPFDPLGLLLMETAMGNERAFARLYELTSGRMLGIARGIVGRADVAEDVVQDSFVRIWRWAHRYNPDKGAAYAWLVRVVRNRALTARAQLNRHEDRHGELDADMALDQPDPADQAMRSEEARRVYACLANLPFNHRRSITMVYFEGLTHSELAERLDVRLGTAKSWVRRGLAQMNRCLTGGADAGWRELVGAEYAAGSLEGAVRRGFERRRERDARYCRAVDLWEDRLAALTEFLPSGRPAPMHLWSRIEQTLAPERRPVVRPQFWQATTALLAIAAVTLLLLVILR